MLRNLRRLALALGLLTLAPGLVWAQTARTIKPALAPQTGSARYEFMVRDKVFLNVSGKDRLARIYQPRGDGSFPTLVLVHGGGWNDRDRTDSADTALALADAGILVISIEYRLSAEAPYPASSQDVNYAVRWAKAHAGEFGGRTDKIGVYGSSAGGLLATLAALRPDDPRYAALPLPEAPKADARVAYLISGWSVLYPLNRLHRAEAIGLQSLVSKHAMFFGTPEAHLEATPALILERGEVKQTPPALFFEGTLDRWTTTDELQRLAADWRRFGGAADVLFLDGEPHTFLNNDPFSDNSLKTLKAMIAFIKAHG